MQQSDDSEQFEQIPWDVLAAANRPTQIRKWIYLAAAVIVVGTLTASLTQTLWRSAPSVSVVAPPSSTPQATVPEEEAPVAITSISMLWSEADLMAGAGESNARAAAALSELAIAEYLTIDGSQETAERVRQMFGLEVETIAHDSNTMLSYVEWVGTIEQEQLGPGLFRSVVLVRSLRSADGSGYRRAPTAAFQIDVQLTDDGWRLEGLPRPFEVSPFAASVGLELVAGIPVGVIDVAMEKALQWGTDPEPIGGVATGTGWRVDVMVEDEHGARWPIAVDVEN